MNRWSTLARRIRVPLGFVFAALYLWLARPSWRSIGAGVIIVVPGVLLRAAASGRVRKSLELTTTGPYAYSRNPLYLGTLIMAIGFVVAAWNVGIAIAAGLIFIFIYFPVMRWEEDYLRAHFREFGIYAQNVPRFLPRLNAWRDAAAASGAENSGFSRELYFQHREYNSVLGAVAVATALLLKLVWFNQ
jgi:protein-S-isoprenylcysteine O-methyltransferase Ste14